MFNLYITNLTLLMKKVLNNYSPFLLYTPTNKNEGNTHKLHSQRPNSNRYLTGCLKTIYQATYKHFSVCKQAGSFIENFGLRSATILYFLQFYLCIL